MYSSMRIGGEAKKLFIPESVNELQELILKFPDAHYLAAGSNVLINDKHSYETVILLTKFNDSIEALGNGSYRVGASVKITKLINSINKHGYGGLELLYGIPATVGGCAAMNAGFADETNKSTGYFVFQVQVLEKLTGHLKTFTKKECEFGYRDSLFKKNKDLIITEIVFCFEKKTNEEIKKEIDERIKINKSLLKDGRFSLGSIFLKCDRNVMRLMCRFSKLLEEKDLCRFSQWNIIAHNGNGTYSQAIRLIKATKIMNILFLKKAELEIEIWE